MTTSAGDLTFRIARSVADLLRIVDFARVVRCFHQARLGVLLCQVFAEFLKGLTLIFSVFWRVRAIRPVFKRIKFVSLYLFCAEISGLGFLPAFCVVALISVVIRATGWCVSKILFFHSAIDAGVFSFLAAFGIGGFTILSNLLGIIAFDCVIFAAGSGRFFGVAGGNRSKMNPPVFSRFLNQLKEDINVPQD
ncbi:hypothetical protein J7382_18725 [Shimia sp. R11_0]|uniref:hypothetical protein n=1 Tax=Shimia sp. R11_0 TaxID=2821096 RepID=UPI001ADBC44B|nr:hypothetical protein [Shimia sp. R11_0]MBO9479585.1 hypothetical protein [Shimia sp. R11_0]